MSRGRPRNGGSTYLGTGAAVYVLSFGGPWGGGSQPPPLRPPGPRHPSPESGAGRNCAFAVAMRRSSSTRLRHSSRFGEQRAADRTAEERVHLPPLTCTAPAVRRGCRCARAGGSGSGEGGRGKHFPSPFPPPTPVGLSFPPL